jgi:hypothetical protein
LEQVRPNTDTVALRMMIITSFLLGATMLLLSLNVATIKQSSSGGPPGPADWALSIIVVSSLISSLIMLFMSALILVTMDLGTFTLADKLRAIARVRTFLGVTSFLILASFGSTFILSLGVESPVAWVLGAMGYGGAIFWGILRNYYMSRIAAPKRQEP